MARLSVTMIKAAGDTLTAYFDSGDQLTASVDDTLTIASWCGVAQVVKFLRAFRWRLTRAKDVGETVSYADDNAIRTLHMIVVGQSNAEGRGDTADAPSVTNSSTICPATYPTDLNHSGPGAPNYVGPALIMADAIMDDGDHPFTRLAIHSTATGNQTIAQLYGTNGDDGTYATQRDHADVLAGKINADPCGQIETGDDYIIVYNQGEADASSGAPADWSADVQALLDHIVDTDYAGATCRGVVVNRFPPSAPDDGDPSTTHPDWPTIRTEQGQLENEAGTPPQFLVDLVDADRQAADKVHIATGTDSSAGWRRAAPVMAAAILPTLRAVP